MDLNLTGKTALITAASGGIGSGVAEALAKAGARVAISGRTLASLEVVAEKLASCAAQAAPRRSQRPPTSRLSFRA